MWAVTLNCRREGRHTMIHETAEKTPLKVLCLESSPRDTEIIRDLLTEAGYELTMDCTVEKSEFISLLRSRPYDVILSDFKYPGFDAFEALRLSIDICPHVPFICVSGSVGEDTAIELMKQGVVDYVLKDRIARLPSAIKRAHEELKDRNLRQQAEKTLRASEERYRAMVTTSPDALFVHVEDRVTFVNPSFCQMLGAEGPSQLIGKSVFGIVHPKYHETIRQRRNQFSGAQPAPLLEAQFVRLDGGTVDVEMRAVAIDWQGSRGVQVIARSIADRKRVEEAVRDSEERFRMVFEHVFDGISIYSEDPDPAKRGLVECNERYAAMAGRSREELLALGSTQGLQKTLENAGNSVRLKSLDKGTAYQGSFSWIRPDGKDNVIEYIGMPITWRGKSYSIGIDRDITERKKAEESQLLLTTALESTANGVAITDLEGNIVFANNAFTETTGYTLAEVLGHNTRILKSGKHDESSYDRLWTTVSAGHVWQGELINKKKDGSLYTEEMTITPLKKDNGVVTHFIAIKQDITERKKAEQELRLMAQTIASAQDCITITDLENKFLFVNDAFQHTFGYTAQELLGKDVAILRSPATTTADSDRILRNTQDGGWHGEIINRRKDGTDFPVELWTSVVKDEAGSGVAIVGVARNITDRQVANEHLRKSEEQFRLIAENVADMIAVVDLEGRRIYNSPSYRNILGDPESLKATDAFQEIHPDDVARVRRVFQETVRTGIGQRIEYRFLLRDGSIRDIDSKGSVIRGSDGKISQVIIVSRDVTEEKRLAAQFLRAQRMESIGTLAGGIAHDLNNVLAPIMMAIEVLRDKMPDPGGQKILNMIETSAKRGADIVKQVLAFGRGVKGERILVQLKHVVNELVKISIETFPKSIEITTDIPRDLWMVYADPTQMHQVLLNVLINARDAMPGGGILKISAENITLNESYSRTHPDAKRGAYICIVITDTGAGIPANIQEKIFEPFFTTKEIGMGTGLGLSTTLAIIKSHEGFINLHSEEGKGTTFRIYIPATGASSTAAAASEEADLPTGHGELILIIDDEAAIREITKETLKAHGYKAMTASDGAEGVAIFAENKRRIKVVITDIMMPVMNGTAAILALKKINPDVKIIAASGLATKGQIPTPLDSNVQAFVTKPYTAEKLLKTLAEVLR